VPVRFRPREQIIKQMVKQNMIEGGYILQPRIIEESEVYRLSPCARETWQHLLLTAYHKDYGNLKRGQLFTSIDTIREALSWFVGYRKEGYSRRQIEGSFEAFRERGMIVTTKVTHGIVITICKYDYYQDPKNYECNNEGEKKDTTKGRRSVRQGGNINKNVKNDKNVKNENKEKTPEKISGGVEIDFVDQIINVFIEEYGDYTIVNRGKERDAAGKILSLYKKQYPNSTTEEALIGLRVFFRSCIDIKNEWLRTNMSIPLIVSRFNEIKKELKNEKNGKNKPVGATDRELAELMARKYGVNATHSPKLP